MPGSLAPSRSRAGFLGGPLPGRRGKTRADALAHQRVIGRVKLYEIPSQASRIESLEPGRVLIGEARELERLGPSERGSVREHGPLVARSAESRDGSEQRPVEHGEIDVDEGRRLIEDFMGGESIEGHGDAAFVCTGTVRPGKMRWICLLIKEG
jgi:hypothetical protein